LVTRRVRDRGFRNFEKNTRRAHRTNLKVGIFRDAVASRSATPGNDANNLAYRYSIHDQGLGRNPKRETLVPAIERSLRSDKIVNSFLNSHLHREPREFKRQVNRAGLRLSANVKKGITALKNPPKRQSTIDAAARRYGGIRQNPLIQTGEMRGAVNFRYGR